MLNTALHRRWVAVLLIALCMPAAATANDAGSDAVQQTAPASTSPHVRVGPVGKDPARASQLRFMRPSYLCPAFFCGLLSDYPVPWEPDVADQPFVFATEINVPIVFNTLGDAMVDHGAWAFGGTILPAFQARMLASDSWPVSTPSFQPAVFFDLYYLTHPDYTYAEQDWARRVVHTGHAALGLEHHSNGQEVCPLLEDLAQPRYHSSLGDDCNPNAVRWSDANVNYRTGEFSSTKLLLRLDYELNTLGSTSGAEVFGVVVGLTGRIELPRGAVGALEREHRTLHGTASATLRLQAWSKFEPANILPFARLTLDVSGSAYSGEALDDLDPPQHHLSAELRWTLDALAGGGFYTRWEHGRDPYNIRYLSPLHLIHVGIVFEPRTDIYRRPRNAPAPPAATN